MMIYDGIRGYWYRSNSGYGFLVSHNNQSDPLSLRAVSVNDNGPLVFILGFRLL